MKRLQPSRFPRRRPSRLALMRIYKTLYRHYGPLHWWPGETPFEVIVGAILTQSTSWANVVRAIQNLKDSKRLSPKALFRISEKRLAKLIRPAGYFNVKAKRLKNFLHYLKTKHNGSVQAMFQEPLDRLRMELLGVNGIGKETADSILLYAGQKQIFVVDAYTRRVLARHRYISGGENYEEIQRLFTKFLPKSTPLYNEYHAQIVQVGKDYCRRKPLCSLCPLQKYL